MKDITTKAIIVGLFLALVFAFFSLEEGSLILGLVLGIIFIPGPLILYVLSNKFVVQITEDDIKFKRFGKKIESVPFENNEFTAYIYTIRLQLVITGQKRYLRAIDLYGKIRDYSCDGLSERDFNKFVSEVISISAEKQLRILTEQKKASMVGASSGAGVADTTSGVVTTTADVAVAPEAPFAGAVFTFPKDKFREAIYKKLTVKLLIIGLIALFLAVTNFGFFSILLVKDVQKLIMELFFPLTLICASAIAGFIFWSQYKTQLECTPDYIRITENELMIDDRKYFLSDIKSIKMSRERFIPRDKNRLRTIKIVIAGKIKLYYLGHMSNGDRRFFYDDYGRLCNSLSAFLLQDGRLVKYELF